VRAARLRERGRAVVLVVTSVVLVAGLGVPAATAATVAPAASVLAARPPAPNAAAGAVVVEPAPASTAQQVSAVLELQPPAGSDAAVAGLAARARTTPAATRRAELERWAPSLAVRGRATAWAARHGLAVVAADRWSVTVTGSPADVAAAFATRLVDAGAGHVRAANQPAVPTELAGAVRSVLGLDTRPLLVPHAEVRPPAGSARASFVLGDAGFTGPQLRSAYGMPAEPTAGAGVAVATVQFSGVNPTDVLSYAAAASIPVYTGQLTLVSVDGTSPTTPVDGGDVEVALDMESILAVAPMARQRAYVAANTLSGLIGAYNRLATDAEAGRFQTASSSWGHCEAFTTPTERTAVVSALNRMLAAGVTMSASTGDSGSNDCGNGSTAVDFPASTPQMVATGGTNLVNGYQAGWNGGGGGTSTQFAKPAYQAALSGSFRKLPDVALLSDPSTGFAMVHGGSYKTAGGTSLAAPLFAGLLASVLSAADVTSGVGDVHAELYTGVPAKTGFQDVVTGDNGAFTAGPGYDQVTGLGAPRFGALAATLGVPAQVRAHYVPVDPVRLADSRTGAGVPKAKLGAGATVTVTAAGAPGVPASGVVAVVVNVTAVGATASTYLSVFPTGGSGATTSSSVNVTPGIPIPNLVTSKTDALGRVSVYNSAGSTDLLVDLVGYYVRDTGSGFQALTPARVLDTRGGIGAPRAKLGPGGTVTLKVAGTAGLPASGLTAVVLNVTAVNASQTSYVSVYPKGFAGGPATSSLNVTSGRTVANLVVSKVSADGYVTLFNSVGTVDLVADATGWFDAAGAPFSAVAPVRVLDTRLTTALGTGEARSFGVASASSLPTGVALNVAGVGPTVPTYLSLYPLGVPDATGKATSTLQVYPGTVRANGVLVGVTCCSPPMERVANYSGRVNVLADVTGFYSAQPTALPQGSVTLSGPSTVTIGTNAHFTATVTGTAVTGRVMLVDDDQGVQDVASGTATPAFDTTALAVGTHHLRAVVASADTYLGITSDPVTVTVTP
jgi:hypothetical protein